MTLLGLIFMGIAVMLFFLRHRQQKRAFSLQSARRTTVAEIETTANAVAKEIGGGDWRDYVKLWGTIQAEQPLISELKERLCVSYSVSVVREYEETVQTPNQKGELSTATQRRSEIVSSHRQSIPFFLQDQTGRVLVDPEGANLEMIEVLNQFQPGEPSGGLLSVGNLSLALSQAPQGSNRRTLGYRYRETVLPVGRSVLVVGTVSDHGGRLTVLQPTQGHQQFIISLKNDEALTTSAERNARRLLYGMVGCAFVGFVMILAGL